MCALNMGHGVLLLHFLAFLGKFHNNNNNNKHSNKSESRGRVLITWRAGVASVVSGFNSFSTAILRLSGDPPVPSIPPAKSQIVSLLKQSAYFFWGLSGAAASW